MPPPIPPSASATEAIRQLNIFNIYIFAFDSMPTNSIPASASVYYRIKLVYISLGKRYSFPFSSATIAIVRV
jgi:hypothetical protein